MHMWAACLWGLGGAAAFEGWTLHEVIDSVGGFPWKHRGHLKVAPYAVAVLIRLGVGVIVTAACSASGQVAGPVAALAVGVAAPKILQQMFRRIPSRPELFPPSVGQGQPLMRRRPIVPPVRGGVDAQVGAPVRRRRRRVR
jgi:hypothetical protein